MGVSTRVLYLMKGERDEQSWVLGGRFLKAPITYLAPKGSFPQEIFKFYRCLKLHLYNFTGKFALKPPETDTK